MLEENKITSRQDNYPVLGSNLMFYPVTIVQDRYSGAYSGHEWTAWHMNAYNVPDSICSNDIDCGAFWSNINESEYADRWAGGGTPNEAYYNLLQKVGASFINEPDSVEDI